MTVARDLFGREQPEYVKQLADEENSLVTMCMAAGRELLAEWKGQIIAQRPFEQILAIVSQAQFKSTPHEQVSVAGKSATA